MVSTIRFIYRAAMGVAWDDDAGCLFLRDAGAVDPLQGFARIRAALADEYGGDLLPNADTRWSGISADLRARIEGRL